MTAVARRGAASPRPGGARGTRLVARLGVSVPFVVLGLQAATRPGGRVALARRLNLPLADLMVRANGAAMVVGGVALAVGWRTRAAGLLLAALLVPTTVAGHRFWDAPDDAAAHEETIHALKNLGLAAGAIGAGQLVTRHAAGL